MLPEMNDKEADIEIISRKALTDKALLSEILEGLKSKNETFRYNCHKVLMLISNINGELLYPHWNYFIEFLDSKNSYHKMSAVHLIANLTQVDSEERFEGILNKYYNLLDDKSMILAIYVASSSGRIVKAKPHLEKIITDKLLNIDKTHHNEERKPLIKGGAIESFDQYFIKASDKESIIKFVQEQQDCDSPKTRKLARDFLQKHMVYQNKKGEYLQMTETKYGQHILKGLIRDIDHYGGYSIVSHNGELDTDCCIGYHCIEKPMSFDRPHSHNFVEILSFIGGNPKDITDLGAEIEVYLGEEGEKHIITETSVVSIPAGLVHCPINITKVDKPFIFLEISLTREYGKPVAKSQ